MRISMANKAMSIQEGFDAFLRHCEVKGYSKNTLTNYRSMLTSFSGSIDLDLNIAELDNSKLEAYIYHLKHERTVSDMSLGMYTKNLRAMLNYFKKMGYLDSFEIPTLRLEKKVKETYTDSELERLLQKPNTRKCEFTEYRNWVLINYLLSTGNRLSTVINLKVKDLDFESNIIRLTTTKNKKQQYIPMSITLVSVLMEYLSYRKVQPENYVFCNLYGQPMSKSCISIAIRNYNRSHGVNKTSIHLFRHTFAKKWILAGGDIFRLQKMLGHSTLDVVKEYVNMFSDDLQRDFEKFNALDQIHRGKEYIKLK